jgi:presqualene diphosphate synthase
MTSPRQTVAQPAPIATRSSFYTAMRILPPAQREAMFGVYAFCRAVDDIADDGGPVQERLAALDQWRRDIDRLYAQGGASPLTAKLQPAIAGFGLAQADFVAVIDGMEMDVQRDMRAPDWQMLDLYCDRVASAVGRLSVQIFGLHETNGLPLAHHLGRALQLTNILRDLDEDAVMGRLYLPREALTEAGIAHQDVAKVLADPSLDKACSIVAGRARDHFDEAGRIMVRCERNNVRSPRLMAAVYRPMLEKLVSRGWSPPRHKLRHSTPLIIWAVLRHGFL